MYIDIIPKSYCLVGVEEEQGHQYTHHCTLTSGSTLAVLEQLLMAQDLYTDQLKCKLDLCMLPQQ